MTIKEAIVNCLITLIIGLTVCYSIAQMASCSIQGGKPFLGNKVEHECIMDNQLE